MAEGILSENPMGNQLGRSVGPRDAFSCTRHWILRKISITSADNFGVRMAPNPEIGP
ncbi:MAG TPA: hypothetical protein VGK93_02450 [Candidatus Eisenbacteria bacterium]|jgi:hypothetical protein